MLLFWSGVEAALRYVAEAMDIPASDSPLQLLKTVYSSGVINASLYEQLNRTMKIRNAYAHGFATPKVPAIRPVANRVITLLERFRTLDL